MKDIEFKIDTQKFKFRVNGIIINNNKILTIKMKNNVSYCLPGGHTELGEDTRTAILREMLEEVDTPVSIDNELAVVENFYTDKKNFEIHEISFYFIVKPENFEKIPMENYQKAENDKGEIKVHNFEWLDISSLNDYDFRPAFLKKKIMDADYTFEHIIKRS